MRDPPWRGTEGASTVWACGSPWSLVLLFSPLSPLVAAAAPTFDRLKQLAAGWHEIDPSDAVRETAVRFLRVHPLRTADALQLAAAFVAAERRPSSLEIVTLDERLAAAARKEGFVLVEVPPAE